MSSTVQLDADMKRHVSAVALATDRTDLSNVHEAIEEPLQDMEDANLAQAELEAVRAGRSKTVTLEAMLNRTMPLVFK